MATGSGSSAYRRSTPPSSDALRHSGGDRRRCTSATVTLYLEVELRSERRPGTEQKTSVGAATPDTTMSLAVSGFTRIPAAHAHTVPFSCLVTNVQRTTYCLASTYEQYSENVHYMK